MLSELRCVVTGCGAWGPGFNDWNTLQALLRGEAVAAVACVAPAPAVIPATERRRAPHPVKLAVEVSSQAIAASGLAADEVACVFGSGLGDTEITDYMCRVVTTELKQLSPTRFHNSVHNAAAGYWTISTGCMKSANSIAAYHMTAGLALLEGMTQCALQQEPVLITLFDTAAHAAYRQIFPCSESFGAALVLQPFKPDTPAGMPLLTLLPDQLIPENPVVFATPQLTGLHLENPAAKVLALLDLLAHWPPDKEAEALTFLQVSHTRSIRLQLSGTV